MNNLWRRSLSFVLALVMVIGMVPVNAFATEADSTEAPSAEVPVTTAPEAATTAPDAGDGTLGVPEDPPATTQAATTAPEDVPDAPPATTAAPEATVDPAVAEVQAMMDALPTEVNSEEEALLLEEMILEVDDAMGELYTEQINQLDFTTYVASMEALQAYWDTDWSIETFPYSVNGSTLRHQDVTITEADLLAALKKITGASSPYAEKSIATGSGFMLNGQKINGVAGQTVGNLEDGKTYTVTYYTYSGKWYSPTWSAQQTATFTYEVYHVLTAAVSPTDIAGGVKVTTPTGTTTLTAGQTMEVDYNTAVTFEGVAVNDYSVESISGVISPVKASGTVTVTYKADVNYVVSATESDTAGGVVTINGEEASNLEVGEGKSATIVVAPASGNSYFYTVDSITVDGVDKTPAQADDGTYTVSIAAVNANTEIEVTYSKTEIKFGADKNTTIDWNGFYADGTKLSAAQVTALKQLLFTELDVEYTDTIAVGDVTIQYLPYHAWDIIIVGSGTGYDDENVRELGTAAPDDVDIVNQTNIYSNFGERGYNDGAAFADTKEKVRLTHTATGLWIEQEITLTEERDTYTVSYTDPGVTFENQAQIDTAVKNALDSANTGCGTITATIVAGQTLPTSGQTATLKYDVTVADNENYLGTTTQVSITATAKVNPATVNITVVGDGSATLGTLSGTGTLVAGTYTLTATPNGNYYVESVVINDTPRDVATLGNYGENRAWSSTVAIENEETYNITVTFAERTLTAQTNPAIDYNFYYDVSDKVDHVKQEILDHVVAYTGGTLTKDNMTVEVYNNSFKVWYNITGAGTGNLADSTFNASSEQLRITWAGDKRYPEMTVDVSVTVKELRKAPTFTLLDSDEDNIFAADTADIFKTNVEGAVKAYDYLGNEIEPTITVTFDETIAEGENKVYAQVTSAGETWLANGEPVALTAVYQINEYTVKFFNYDDSPLSETDYDYGTPADKIAQPTATKADKVDEDGNVMAIYKHTGWTPAVAEVTANAEYKATFEEVPQTYSVVWADDTGKTLGSKDYAYGDTPKYESDTPVKVDTAKYTYKFEGWTTELASEDGIFEPGETVTGVMTTLPAVTGNATYYAAYSATLNKYTITFVGIDADGNASNIQSGNVAYGTAPTCTAPSIAATAQYTYTFQGWSTEKAEIREANADLTDLITTLPAVTGEATYYAVFTRKLNQYTITWNDRGAETQSTLAYGEKIVPATLPGYTDADGNSWDFAGWDGPDADEAADAFVSTTVTGDVTYKAVYATALHDVTFIINGVSTTQKIKDGETTSEPAVEGYRVVRYYTKDGETETVFNFATPITAPVTIYVETIKQYTVSYNTVGGNAVASETVDVNSVVTLPTELGGKDDHVFSHWTLDGETVTSVTVTGDVTVVAVWKQLFNVTFKNGTSLHSTSADIAAGDKLTTVPTLTGAENDGKVFKGWSATENPAADAVLFDFLNTSITSDITVYAVWGADRDNDNIEDGAAGDPWLTYIWMDGDDEIDKQTGKLDADNITSANYAGTVNLNATDDNRKFVQWTESVSGTTTTYTAVWADDTNNNDVCDADEQITITLVKTGSAANDGSVAATISGKAVEFGKQMLFNSKDGKLVVTATAGTSDANTNFKAGVVTVTDAEGNKVTNLNNITPGTYTVTVSFEKEELTGKASAEIGFIAPATTAGHMDLLTKQLDVLKQEIFNKLAVSYFPDGVTYDQVKYEAKYWQTYSISGNVISGPSQTDNYVEIGIDPADYDPDYGYYTRHPFGYTGLGTVEHVKLSYNGLSIEADVTLVDGRVEPTITLDTSAPFEADTYAGLNEAVLASGKITVKNNLGQTVTASVVTDGDVVDNGNGTYTVYLKVDNDGDTWKASTKPTSFIVKLDVNEYTITWLDGNGDTLTTTQVPYGTAPTYPTNSATPTKTKDAEFTYTWDNGWDSYVDGQAISGTDLVAVTGPATYIATFTGTTNEYTITWNAGDGYFSENKKQLTTTVPYGQTPEAPEIPDKEGDWGFAGWNPAVTSVTGEADYTATYSLDTVYTVSFPNAEGVAAQILNLTNTPDAVVVKPEKDPSRDGYRFDGWFADEACTTAYVFNQKPTASHNVYAKWVKQVTVSFNTDGAGDIADQTFDIGGKATLPTAPNKADWAFDNWYLGNAVYDFNTAVNNDITLTAKWLDDSANNNEVPDANEVITLVVGNHGTASFTAKATTMTHVYDSVKGETITIIATPEAQYYAVPINGTTNVRYSGNVMTAELVIPANAGKGSFTVNINFAQDDIGLKDGDYSVGINGFSAETKAENLKKNILKAVLKDSIPESEYGSYTVYFKTSISDVAESILGFSIGDGFGEEYWNIAGGTYKLDLGIYNRDIAYKTADIVNLLTTGNDKEFKIVRTYSAVGHPDREEYITIDVVETRPKVNISLGDKPMPTVDTDEQIEAAIKDNLKVTYVNAAGDTVDVTSAADVSITSTFVHSAAADLEGAQDVTFTVAVEATADYVGTGTLPDEKHVDIAGKIHNSVIVAEQSEIAVNVTDRSNVAPGTYTITVTPADLKTDDGDVTYVETVSVSTNGGEAVNVRLTWSNGIATGSITTANGDSASNTYTIAATFGERELVLNSEPETGYSVYYNPIELSTENHLKRIYDLVVSGEEGNGPGCTEADAKNVVTYEGMLMAGPKAFTIVWAGNDQIPTVTKTVTVNLNDERTKATIEATGTVIEIDTEIEKQDLEDVLEILKAQTENAGAAVKISPNDARAKVVYELVEGKVPASGETATIRVKVTVTEDGISWLANEQIVEIPVKGKELPSTVTVTENLPDQGEVTISGDDVYMNEKLTITIDPSCGYDAETKTGTNGYYVKSVTVNGEDAKGKWNATNYTFELEVGYNETYDIQIEYAEGKFTLDADGEMLFYQGIETPTYEKLYEALITDPAYDASAVKEAKYLARPAGTYTIKIPVLFEFDLSQYGLGSYKIGGDDYEVELEDAWLDVGEQFKTLTEEELQSMYDDELEVLKQKAKNIDLSAFDDIDFSDLFNGKLEAAAKDLLAQVTEITNELNDLVATIENEAQYLGYHQFGALTEESTVDENGNVQELVSVIYYDGVKYISKNDLVITLIDDRATVTLSGGNLEFEYDEYTNADLLSAIVVTDEDGNVVDRTTLGDRDVYILSQMAGMDVGEYTYNVYFDGNETYKPTSATFTLTVIKAPANVTIPNINVTYGEDYNGLPVITNKHDVQVDAGYIDFIVGLDVADFDMDDDTGAISGLQGKVQLMIPDEFDFILKLLNLEEGVELKLSEMIDLVDSASGVLGNLGVSEDIATSLNEVLSYIDNILEGVDVVVVIGGEYPTDVGVYLHGAVTIDSNYETAYNIGYIIIKPDAEKVYLDWNYSDENGIYTPELMQYIDFAASAYDDEALTVLNPEATEIVRCLYLGIDLDGELVLEMDATKLNNGAYTEIAFTADFGNEMYYAEPIIRAFVVVPNLVDVEIEDAEDTNTRTFNNQEQALDVTLEYEGSVLVPDAENLTMYYVGMQTNTHTWNGQTPPIHAGVYLVTALYVHKDADGTVIGVGADVETLTILPAETTTTVDDLVVTVGTEVAIEDMITVETDSGVTSPDMTVITAQINTDGTYSENGWDAIQGNINVDFPRWVDDLMEQYAPSMKNGMTVAEFAEKVSGKLPELVEELNEAGVGTDITDILTKVITEVTDILAEVPENVTLTFNDVEDLTQRNVGAYLVAAVVTDSDHIPSADAGILVIAPEMTTVELKWNYEDENGVWTRELLKYVDLNASAFNEDGTLNEEATAIITHKFVGIDKNGDLIVTEDAAELPNGAYVEMAYIELELDGKMVVSNMIARPIVLVPGTAQVIFVDESGAENNDRHFVFDNTGKTMPVQVSINGEVITPAEGTLTFTYAGVQTNLKEYYSNTAPVHAGAYAVIAEYVDYDEDGNMAHVGVAVGAMAIEPAASSMDVTGSTVTYDGNGHGVASGDVTVTATGAGVNPDYTMISGGVTISGDISEVGLDAFHGNVNIDFPVWLDKALAETEAFQEGISPAYLIRFIQAYRDDLIDLIPADELTALGVEEAQITEVTDKMNGYIDELITAIGKLPEDVTLTFQDGIGYIKPGYYGYYGIVTDSDHYPSTDTGLLVIEKKVMDFGALHTVVPYDGKGHTVEVVGPEGVDYISIIVDNQTKNFNIVLEEDMMYFIGLVEDVLGVELPTEISIADLLALLGEENADKVASALPLAMNMLIAEYGEQLSESAKERLDILSRILADLSELGTITINGDLPKDAGAYEHFLFAFSEHYKMTDASAVLFIEPIRVEVDDEANSKVYGTSDPELTASVRYYSIQGVEDLDALGDYDTGKFKGYFESYREDSFKHIVASEVEITELPDDIELAYDVVREEGEDIGTYAMSVENASIIESANYELKVVKDDTLFEITPAALTITINDKSKYYGDADPDWTCTIEGLTNGDTAEDLNIQYTRVAGENVGEYTITATASNDNYTINIIDGTLTINPAQITITRPNATKVYNPNNTTDPENPVQVNVVKGKVNLAVSTSREPGNNVGTYSYTVTYTKSDNYIVTENIGALTITPATIVSVEVTSSHIYTGSEQTATLKVMASDGVETWEMNKYLYTASGNKGTEAGDYTVTVTPNTNLTKNYTVTDPVTATWTIMPAKAAVIVADQSKYYGDEDPTLTYEVEGLRNGDTLAVQVTREAGEDVGTYAIKATASDSNYDIVFTNGTLTINKAAVTITVDDQTKVYGEADPELTYSYEVTSGAVSAEELGISVSRVEGETVGEYTINASYTESDNYDVTVQTGKLTITKAAVTITVDNQTKVYGEADPALTYKTEGLVNGDTLAVQVTRETGENVGTYEIKAEASSDNYEIKVTNGTLTITKAAITITVDDQTKVYGDADPELTYSYKVTSGAVTEEELGISVSRVDGANVGEYTINATYTESDNYDVTVETGTLTIAPAKITSAAVTSEHIYNGKLQTAELVVKAGNLVLTADDYTVTGNTGTDAGTYTVTVAGTGNYIGEATATWTIAPAKITSVVAAETTYSGAEQTADLTVMAGDLVLDADDYTVTGNVKTDAGKHTVTVTGKGNFYGSMSATWTIAPKAVTVTVEDAEMAYGSEYPEFNCVIDGAVKDGDITVTPIWTGKDAGKYEIDASYTASSNYAVTVKKGTLTINPAKVAIVINDKTIDIADEIAFVEGEDYTVTVETGKVTAEELNLVISAEVEKNAAGQIIPGTYEIKATYADPTEPNNWDVTVTVGELTVELLGDYVCWNVQAGVYYDDLSDALDDVDDPASETIQMLKDYEETYVIIAPGTTLDLDDHTVTAQFVVGLNGSFLTGMISETTPGKLVVKPENMHLCETCYFNGTYDVLPIYNPDGYFQFAVYQVSTTGTNRGLTVEDGEIYFQFVVNTNKFIRKGLMKNGVEDNEMSIIVRLEWQTDNGNGTAYQDFVYKESEIKRVYSGNQDFYLRLKGYEALEIDLDTLVVKGAVVTSSGATSYGTEWTVQE